MKKFILIIATAATFAGCQQKENVDMILRNAKIYTVNNNFTVQQGAAIRNGKFVAVSSDANIRTRYYSDNIIDLKGKYVFPAFIDAHSRFIEYALTKADSNAANLPDSQLAELLKKAENDCFSMGITSVSDYGTSYNHIKLIDSLQKTGFLNIDLYCVLEPSAENIRHYLNNVPYFTNQLKVLSVGISLDGSISKKNAVLLSGYADKTNAKMKMDADSLNKICQMAYEHGFQVCASCSGDSATRLVFKTFADILPRKNNCRWRVENLQMTNMRDLRYLTHYSLTPVITPDDYAAAREKLPQLLNKKQLRETFAWKKILGQNQGIVCGTNDVGLTNPMQVMYSSMRQEKRKLQNKQGQELTSTQALKSMTIWAAYAQFDEKEKGSIEVGKNADFIITNENLTTMYKPNLPNVKIISTYLRGQKVYDISE